MVTFVVVPQWQGSGSSRAMRLVEGADAIRGDLPTAATRVVDIPLEAGDELGSGVHRISSIGLVRARLAEVLAEVTGPAITIGGDCGVELGAIEHVLSLPDVAIVWFDAHPDLNTPESSPSRAFSGMVLRTLLGDGPAELVPSTPLAAGRVVVAGARSFDAAEDEFLATAGIRSIGADEVSGQTLVAALEATGATSVYLHIDLDVLDPGELTGLGYPEPFGVAAGTLVDTIKAIVARFPLAGAGLTGFAPASAQDAAGDLPTILRVIAALTSAD